MTVAETQAALSRLYVDDAFRNWFALAPSDALESYALTPAEREALASIDGKMLALFAANLREKRATKILTSYPLCRALFKDELTRYFERYYELHPAHPGESSADQIVSFGRFLAGSLVGSPDAPPCAVDLCRYELAINEVRLTFWPIDDLHAIMAPDEPGPTGEYPKLAPGVKVMSFDYDIPDIARCIEEGTSGGPAQPSRTHVTIKPVARSAPGVFRVNEITASLLALCDGDRSLDEIARDLGQDVGREALVGVLARMRDNGLVSKSWGE